MVCASASDILEEATALPAGSSWMLAHRPRCGDETHFETDCYAMLTQIPVK
jgi:hypothetical protein